MRAHSTEINDNHNIRCHEYCMHDFALPGVKSSLVESVFLTPTEVLRLPSVLFLSSLMPPAWKWDTILV